MAGADEALDRLLAALDDDPLLNEALGRTPAGNRGKSTPNTKAEGNSPNAESQPKPDLAPAGGFSSYPVMEAKQASPGPRLTGRLEPLGKPTASGKPLPSLSIDPVKVPVALRRENAPLPSHLLTLASEEGPTTAGKADAISPGNSPARSRDTSEQVSPNKATSAEDSPSVGRRAAEEVHIMPYLHIRELPSKGGIAPRRRWGNSVHVVEDSLYVFGGAVPTSASSPATGGTTTQASTIITNDFFSLDLLTMHWEPVFCSKGEIPPARAQHAAALDSHSRLFIHGGNGINNELLGDMHMYDFQTQEWTKVEPKKGKQPSPRADHTLCCLGEKLYLFGGRCMKKNGNGLTTNAELWVFDIPTARWSKKGNAASGTSAATAGQEEEDVAGAAGKVLTAPEKRAGHGATFFKHWLIVNGGERAQGGLCPDTWAFDTYSDTWQLIDNGANSIMPRYRHQLVSVGSVVLAAGGITQYRGNHDVGTVGLLASMELALAEVAQPASTQSQEGGEATPAATTASSFSNQLVPVTPWTPLKTSGTLISPSIRGFGIAMFHGFLCLFGGATAGEAAPNNVRRLLLCDRIPEVMNDSGMSTTVAAQYRLLHEGLAADFFMELSGKRFAAHRALLSIRAPVFLEAVLQCHTVSTATSETNSTAAPAAGAGDAPVVFGLQGNKRVAGLSYPITVDQLEAFLSYLYTGKLSWSFSAEAEAGAIGQGTPEHHFEDDAAVRRSLQELAVTYQVDHLVKVLHMIDAPLDPKRRGGTKQQGAAAAAGGTGGGVSAATLHLVNREAAEAQGQALLRNHLLELSSSTTSVSVTLLVTDPHQTGVTSSSVVHHFILMNRSKFFYRLLRPLFMEGRVTNEVNGATAKLLTSRRGRRAEVSLCIPVQSVKWLLKYLYAGDDQIPPEAVLSVMIAAHTLQLTRLKAICESYLARDEVGPDSACSIIAMATRYDAMHLYEHAVLVAAYCFRQVKNSDAFSTLPDSVKEEITRAAREMLGRTALVPTPASEMKPKEEYVAQFNKSAAPS